MGTGRGKSAGTRFREIEDVLSGMILLWSGAIVDIPAGFVLCDGNNDTPDLRNRFIPGAGDTYAVDDTGGNINHNHDGTTDGHTHWLANGPHLIDVSGFSKLLDNATDTFTSDNQDGRPPYYALCYIMKT